jgi:N-acetylglucosamine-6-phosphate deacetylase
MRIQGRHYATGEPIELIGQQGQITFIGKPSNEPAELRADWVAPAFFDLQINGCLGHSFNSEKLSTDAVHEVIATCRHHGITGVCPTLVTGSFAALVHGLTTLRHVCDADAAASRAMPAFHLEGPYISPEDGPRGAHPREHVRPPDWEEFCRLQEAAAGRIRLMTLAPEQAGALEFIERLVGSGVVAAIGHTAAGGQRIREAVAAGARLSTHLGNGSHAFLPRHDNYVWEQLAADELWASIICDGHHLPPAVVRCITRVKTPARLILTCDASSLAGLPPGKYREWGQDLEVLPSGKIVVSASGYLAGSGAFTDQCVGRAVRDAGVSLQEAVDMAGARPRQLLGLPVPRLERGQAVDLVLFDWRPGEDVRVRAVWP